MASAWQKHLAIEGYTPILRPAADFDIYTLVYEKDGKRGHDNAFDNLAGGAAAHAPAATRDLVTVNSAGEMQRAFEISLGLQVLQGLLSALGAGTLGLSLGFKNASEVTFAYQDVTKDVVSSVDLETFLRTIRAPTDGLLARWLSDNLYIITSTLKAKKIKVSAKSSSGQSVDLDVPVIENAVGGKLKVEAGQSGSNEIVFEGPQALPFAAQLFRLRKYDRVSPPTLTITETKAGSITIKSLPGGDFAAEPIETEELIIPDVLEEGIGGLSG